MDKGIDVCDEWLNFDQFYADMGDPPTDEHTIDRKRGAEGYSPENCRWATRKEQARNTSSNRMFTIGKDTRCASEWAEIRGIPVPRVMSRIRLGWTDPEQIFAQELGVPNRGKKVVQMALDGAAVAVFHSAKEAADTTGIGKSAIMKCLCGDNKSSGGFKWSFAD
jgi:hypothetical protein